MIRVQSAIRATYAVADHRDVFQLPNGDTVMKKSLFASILMVLLEGSFASSVMADDMLVKFEGAIGDIPVANVAGVAHPQWTFPYGGRDNHPPLHPAPPNLGIH